MPPLSCLFLAVALVSLAAASDIQEESSVTEFSAEETSTAAEPPQRLPAIIDFVPGASNVVEQNLEPEKITTTDLRPVFLAADETPILSATPATSIVYSFSGTKRPYTKGGGLKGGGKGSVWTALGLLLIPVLLQLYLVPIAALVLKAVALKALVIGKLALALLAFVWLRHANTSSTYTQDLAKEHYGYTGMPEIGAWVNRRDWILRRKGSWQP